MNDSTLFIKVPRNLKFNNNECRKRSKTLRLYVAYLWFKTRSGEVELNKSYKNRNSYWLKKLLSCGFIYRQGDTLKLKSYQEVWRLMGVEKVNKRGNFGYSYFKIDVAPENFLKDALDQIFKYLVTRKKQQMAYRLARGLHRKVNHILRTETVKYSCSGVAKLLGYGSFSSGERLRKRYFRVIKSKEPRIMKVTESGLPYFAYPCSSVGLNLVCI